MIPPDDFSEAISVKTPDADHTVPTGRFDWMHWLIIVFMAAILSGSIVYLVSFTGASDGKGEVAAEGD